MSESIEIPTPVMQRIESLKRPDESPIDVIARALEILEEDDYIDEATEKAINEGIAEYKAGISISHEDLGKRLGFI